MAKINFHSVDEYIGTFPAEVQDILQSVRHAIREAVPQAEEQISYQMPAFKLHGTLVWYAAWKKHIGLYPRTQGMEAAFKKELSKYEGSKGTIKFPLDKPMPIDLIRRIAQYRAMENTEKKRFEILNSYDTDKPLLNFSWKLP